MSRCGLPRRITAPASPQGGTVTSDGYVPHVYYRGLWCPVMLSPVRTHRGMELQCGPCGRPMPKRKAGGLYVFALPGGQSFEVRRS